MIRVFAYRQGGYYRLLVTGHADYHAGEDIVCAGVSALSCALVAHAKRSPDCHHLRCSVAPGEVFLACRGGLGAGFDTVLGGLALIAEQYPQHVCIEVAEGCRI